MLYCLSENQVTQLALKNIKPKGEPNVRKIHSSF